MPGYVIYFRPLERVADRSLDTIWYKREAPWYVDHVVTTTTTTMMMTMTTTMTRRFLDDLASRLVRDACDSDDDRVLTFRFV